MQGDEKKKKLARTDYLNSYKEATQSEVIKQPDFTEKADNRSPKKKKTKKGEEEKEMPSETYLKNATKENPIIIDSRVSFGAALTQIESNIMAQRYL